MRIYQKGGFYLILFYSRTFSNFLLLLDPVLQARFQSGLWSTTELTLPPHFEFLFWASCVSQPNSPPAFCQTHVSPSYHRYLCPSKTSVTPTMLPSYPAPKSNQMQWMPVPGSWLSSLLTSHSSTWNALTVVSRLYRVWKSGGKLVSKVASRALSLETQEPAMLLYLEITPSNSDAGAKPHWKTLPPYLPFCLFCTQEVCLGIALCKCSSVLEFYIFPVTAG